MTREEHIAEFWISFAKAVQEAGGRIDVENMSQMSLVDVAETLAQNGIRFIHMEDK